MRNCCPKSCETQLSPLLLVTVLTVKADWHGFSNISNHLLENGVIYGQLIMVHNVNRAWWGGLDLVIGQEDMTLSPPPPSPDKDK